MVMVDKIFWSCWMNDYFHPIIGATARDCSISMTRIKWKVYVLANTLGISYGIWWQQTITADNLKIWKSIICFYNFLALTLSFKILKILLHLKKKSIYLTYRIMFLPDNKLHESLIDRQWDIYLWTEHLICLILYSYTVFSID